MRNKVLLSVTFLCTLHTGSLNPVIHPVRELKASDELTEHFTSGYLFRLIFEWEYYINEWTMDVHTDKLEKADEKYVMSGLTQDQGLSRQGCQEKHRARTFDRS